MRQVIFFSRKGNTRKVAEAIAEELGVSAEDVRNASLGPGTDLVFLGSGCYAGKPDRAMLKFISGSDFRDRPVAVFGTSGHGGGSEVEAMATALKEKGVIVKGSYHCLGKGWIPLMFPESRGHPDDGDIAGARRFAREMTKG